MCRTCKQSRTPVSGTKPTKIVGWFGSILGWLLPSVGLAIMPKCPACVVGYVALATGVGISASTATFLRTGLVVLCVGLLLLGVVKATRYLLPQIRHREQIV
ncbi:hypothetical protein Pr1d_07900 [Bythopirellula goksoeyrii]|uniref:Uncharacterized protein n=1 Tax=Bythopirellula goksoeyrii TaxID=1400387 RepID=A0A5B9Q9A7_9BACT|nr:hypothetical protein Pr1d_07900 [Bythopirellula goksoeyrii]